MCGKERLTIYELQISRWYDKDNAALFSLPPVTVRPIHDRQLVALGEWKLVRWADLDHQI